MERDEEQSNKTSLKMKTIRQKLDGCYVKMIKRMEATVIMENNPAIMSFINRLNTIIVCYKNLSVQRQGKAAKKNE